MAKPKNKFVGKTVKIKTTGYGDGCGSGSNHSMPVGLEVKIISVYNNRGRDGFNVRSPQYGQQFVYADELTLSFTVDDIKTEIQDKEAEIAELKMKVDFCTENGLEEFDDEEFKAYKILKVLGLGDIQKAKEVVKILNGNH